MKTFPGYTDLFMSPVTGLIYIPNKQSLTTDYIWVGNLNNVAIESPILIDIRLDIAQIRNKLGNTTFILKEATPWFDNAQALNEVANGLIANLDGVIIQATLTKNNLWIGDDNNIPQPNPIIQLGNLPNLTQNYFWMGDASNRPIEVNILPIGALPDLPYQNIWIGNITNRPTPTQRIDNLNLPPFITVNVANNFGIYNLYTGGTINIAHPLDDPGPVATTTLRVDMSNLPNLKKGRIWMGVVNYTPPIITIDNISPYFHVTGSLNWDIRGFLFDSYAVPTEVGLDPGTIFMGDYSSPGQIVQAGLTWGHIFIGNNLGQIVETTLNDGFTFIGTPTGRITQTGLDAGHLFIGDPTGKIIQTGLNPGWVFIGNNSGQVVQTGLAWGQIFIGDSTNKVTQQGLLAHELWTGLSDNSGRMIATIALEVINLPALALNHIWVGDDTDRPVPTLVLNIVNLPDLTFNKVWVGDNMNRPVEGNLPTEALPDLTFQNLWLGDNMNRPVESPTIEINNLPNLLLNRFWLGNGSSRPVAVSFNIQTGTGLTGGPITNGSGTISIANTSVIAGSYPWASLTVNPQGQLTSASSNLATITEIQTNISTIQGQITAIEADIVAINASLAAITADIVAINAAIAGLAAAIVAINAALAAIDLTLAAHTLALAGLATSVGILQAQILGVFARLDSLEGRVSTLEGEVDTLQEQMSIIISQVADLYSRVITLQSQMSIIISQVADLYSRVDTLDAQVGTLISQVGTLISQMSTVQGQISTIQGQILVIQGQIAAILAALATLAPNNATYILQTPNASLTNAQALSSLSTGLLKNTTTTGVLSIGVPGTDYYAPGFPTYLFDDYDPDSFTGNIKVGRESLSSDLSGVSDSAAFGSGCLTLLTSGGNDTAVGVSVFSNLVSGISNTGVGTAAAYGLPSGDFNTIIGSGALYYANVACNNNTIVGTFSAQQQLEYQDCCFFGMGADASVNALTNAMAIGANAIVGADNTCVIGASGTAMNVVINGIAGAGAGTINAIWNGTPVDLPYGGTNANLTASAGGIVYSTASALAIAPGTPSINKVLLSTIFSAPVWSSLSYPTSAIAGQLIYASSPAQLSALATANNGVLVTNGIGIPSISSTIPFPVQATITTLGTITTGIWNGSIIPMAFGGTSAILIPSIGGMFYSTATTGAILAGTPTANRVILSGASAAPAWSTATYPATTTINQLLYSSAANTITGLATANSSTLMTNGSGIPAWQTTSSNFVTSIAGTANQITASASTGAVTLSLPATVIISTSLWAGNLQLTGNTLQSSNTNGNINITPNGTGTTSFTNNVGFGTILPHSSIQTANSITNRIITLYEGSNNVHEFFGFGINTNMLRYQASSLAGVHAFYCATGSSASTELMRITAGGTAGTGAVGINTTTALAALHVVGGVQNLSGEDSCIRAESANSNAKIELNCTNGTGKLYEIRSNNNGAFDIIDRSAAASRITLLTDGKLGIATTTPSYLLDVNGTARAKKLLGNANAPTVVLGAVGVVGTGATSSVVGSELGGVFTLNTGTGLLGAGTVATFTLTSAMPSSTFSITLTAATTAISTAIYIIATSSTTAVMSVNATLGLLGLTASTTYKWNYQIVGY